MAVEKVAEAHDAMGWLEFIAAMTGSLAWPVAAVVIAWFFRAQISGLLAKVRKLSWGDKVADFSEKLDKIEAARPPETEEDAESPTPVEREPAIELAADTPGPAKLTITDPRGETGQHIELLERRGLSAERFEKMVVVSPPAAVLSAWRPIGLKLADVAKDLGLPTDQSNPQVYGSAHTISALFTGGIISAQTFHQLRALLELRNEAAHDDREISTVDALRFFNLAQDAIIALERQL